MTKLAWTRDGDQWVAKLEIGQSKFEGRITAFYNTPLGTTYHLTVNGKPRGGGNSLKRTKDMFVPECDRLTVGKMLSGVNADMSRRLFG